MSRSRCASQGVTGSGCSSRRGSQGFRQSATPVALLSGMAVTNHRHPRYSERAKQHNFDSDAIAQRAALADGRIAVGSNLWRVTSAVGNCSVGRAVGSLRLLVWIATARVASRTSRCASTRRSRCRSVGELARVLGVSACQSREWLAAGHTGRLLERDIEASRLSARLGTSGCSQLPRTALSWSVSAPRGRTGVR